MYHQSSATSIVTKKKRPSRTNSSNYNVVHLKYSQSPTVDVLISCKKFTHFLLNTSAREILSISSVFSLWHILPHRFVPFIVLLFLSQRIHIPFHIFGLIQKLWNPNSRVVTHTHTWLWNTTYPLEASLSSIDSAVYMMTSLEVGKIKYSGQPKIYSMKR